MNSVVGSHPPWAPMHLVLEIFPQIRHSHAMESNRIILLADGKTVDSPIYRSWTDKLSLPFSYIKNFDITWEPPDDTALIVTAQQFQQPTAPLLFNAVKNNIPVLIIADGILEYRNTWLNPGIVPGSLFQPVVGHKIAVLGNSQARILNSWGNTGKCEVVGSPRLDSLIGTDFASGDSDKFNILVLTARTPGFTEDQTALVRQSLKDLKNWIDDHPVINGKPIGKIIWRLTAGLDEAIGVSNDMDDNIEIGLPELMKKADAVITTPSTTILESMLCRKPVAILDYTNSPMYVPAAWTITAQSHFDSVLPELADPPEHRFQYQTTVLHDALECKTPATPRMIELVEKMVETASDCRKNNRPIEFSREILSRPQDATQTPFTPKDQTADPSAVQVNNEHLLRLARRQQKYINDLLIHVTELDEEIRKSSPLYAKLLRVLTHPKRPKLEPLPPALNNQNIKVKSKNPSDNRCTENPS